MKKWLQRWRRKFWWWWDRKRLHFYYNNCADNPKWWSDSWNDKMIAEGKWKTKKHNTGCCWWAPADKCICDQIESRYGPK